MIKIKKILLKTIFFILLLLMCCISEDVDIDVEYIGVLGYGDIVEVVVNHENNTFKIDNITTGSSETFTYSKISDILLEYELNDSVEYAIEIPNYFLAIPYTYEYNQDIIIALPKTGYKYDLSQISNKYLYYDGQNQTYGTVVLSTEGNIEFTDIDLDDLSTRTSYGTYSDNLDGTLSINSYQGDFSVSGTAAAFGGETLIIDKGTGNGFIFAVKESDDITYESIIGDYYLIYLITYQNGSKIRLNGELSIDENGYYSLSMSNGYSFSGNLNSIIGGLISSSSESFSIQGMAIPNKLITFYSSCITIDGLPDSYNNFSVFIVGAKLN